MSLTDDELSCELAIFRRQLREEPAKVIDIGYAIQVAEQEQDRRREQRQMNEHAIRFARIKRALS